MTNLKTIFFILFLAFSIQRSNAQVYRFMTTSFSVLEKNDKGKWGKWSDLQKVQIVVTLDTKKNRIVIYSQEIQLYEIVEYEPKVENKNDEIYTFNCSDNDGMPFTISIITRKNQNNRKQLYINQKDFIVVYNIVNAVDKNHN